VLRKGRSALSVGFSAIALVPVSRPPAGKISQLTVN